MNQAMDGESSPASSPADPTDGDWAAMEQAFTPTTGSAPPTASQTWETVAQPPLALVETAFLASTASLIWLVNFYFPAGPLLRIFFPVPIAIVYLRWGGRSAGMAAAVSGLLLSVLMGPPRSLLFLIPYGLMGVQLGGMWRRQAGWPATIAIGTIIGSFGVFFRLWLLSILLGEDLWIYFTTQASQVIEWVTTQLVNLGLVSFTWLGEPNLLLIQAVLLGLIILSNVVYLFTVHLGAWLLLERLRIAMPAPPQWVQVLLDE